MHSLVHKVVVLFAAFFAMLLEDGTGAWLFEDGTRIVCSPPTITQIWIPVARKAPQGHP